ncbi:hypothetical protein SAMN05444350_14914 [Bacteroides stercorirosoris]|uniref:Uncharacterized protein n=1 Tax=Bacteroides stercorirosoris TaxID=871324 RepID=A0A1M6LIW4_9BACE|nr:hypothetical protein SAMN05444350_14914 [Bacteroides stercorirosoris]
MKNTCGLKIKFKLFISKIKPQGIYSNKKRHKIFAI